MVEHVICGWWTRVLTAMMLNSDLLPAGYFPSTPICQEERKPDMFVITILLSKSIG